jgi:Protein of unknown function (DUF3352)
VGAGVLPQDSVAVFSFATNEAQWQQLRQFGTPTTQKAVDKNLAGLRDRLLSNNGLEYGRDIKPWIGAEVSVGFLNPFPEASKDGKQGQIQPYNPIAELDIPPTVMVVPIANPLQAQALLGKPKLANGQKSAEREYKGVKVREVYGETQRAYAGAVLDNKLLVLSDNSQAIDRVIDTHKGGKAIAETAGYRDAFKQLESKTPDPFMRLYINVPVARNLTAINKVQPFPPVMLLFFPHSQGIALTGQLGTEGIKLRGLSWLLSDSTVRYRMDNKAERMPVLLPKETVIATSGGNFQDMWKIFSQKDDKYPIPSKALSPDTFRSNLAAWSGLDIDQDIAPWLGGEFAVGVISAPNDKAAESKAGLVMLMQASDRPAADKAFKKFDSVMTTRNFKMTETTVKGKGAIAWSSPFSSLKVTRGWLDGNIAYLAIGDGLEPFLPPSAGTTLADQSTFRQVDSAEIPQNNGHFFLDLERLMGTNATIPVPMLPTENKEFMQSIRAIGITSAIQDARSFRFDTDIRLRKITPLDSLPFPAPQKAVESVAPAVPSPEAAPSPEAPSPEASTAPTASPSP